jgi:YfiH family protein
MAGRFTLAHNLGVPTVFADQVHGTDLIWVDAVPTAQVTVAGHGDALATRLPGVALVIRTADCLPVLMADVAAGLVAAVHVGWRGLLGGILPRVVEELVAAGATPAGLYASVGPGICGRCYEVGEDVARPAAAAGHRVMRTSLGQTYLDLAGSAVQQLTSLGLEHVTDVKVCTATSPGYYSYRVQGPKAGRQGGIVARVASDTP